MKSLYSTLVAMVAFLFLAAGAAAKPPSWDKQINNAGRFKVLSQFGKAAVFDKETGLVWEQSPSITGGPENNGLREWLSAQPYCNDKVVGGRKGWRLPTVQELASLVDPNNPGGDPDLPPDHPFSNVLASNYYWSATTSSNSTSYAWVVHLEGAGVGLDGKAVSDFVWCVRGGQGVDPQ